MWPMTTSGVPSAEILSVAGIAFVSLFTLWKTQFQPRWQAWRATSA